MTGGEAPARAWARFVSAASIGLPARPLLAPDAQDARAGFYGALADELETAADGPGRLPDPARRPNVPLRSTAAER